MPVEREEFFPRHRLFHAAGYHAVVLRSGMIRYDLDHAIRGALERSPGSQIGSMPRLNCAPFVRGIAALADKAENVKQSALIVHARTNGRAKRVIA